MNHKDAICRQVASPLPKKPGCALTTTLLFSEVSELEAQLPAQPAPSQPPKHKRSLSMTVRGIVARWEPYHTGGAQKTCEKHGRTSGSCSECRKAASQKRKFYIATALFVVAMGVLGGVCAVLEKMNHGSGRLGQVHF